MYVCTYVKGQQTQRKPKGYTHTHRIIGYTNQKQQQKLNYNGYFSICTKHAHPERIGVKERATESEDKTKLQGLATYS